MDKIQEVAQRAWDYTLYRDETGYIMTVVFFALIDYPRSFRITALEAVQDLTKLSEDIRNNYSNYMDREVKPPITRPS